MKYRRSLERWRGQNVKEYLLVVLGLALITLVITNFTLLRPGAIFTSAIGDATSGFVWLMSADTDWNPAWAHTNLINFPYGQGLWSPIYITWTLVMAPMWLLAKLFSPIAALNIMTMMGYVTSGMAAYWLVKRLTNRWELSLFAAYAVAFVPYHIMKSSDHLTNVFSWVFVAIIAAFIAFWRQQTRIRGLLLAGSIAAACYTDGYFIFVAGVLLLALGITVTTLDVWLKVPLREIVQKILRLLAVAGLTIALLVPVLFVQIAARDEIQQDLGNARENVKLEVGYYAAKPIDFLLPPVDNPVVGGQEWYEQALKVKNSRSNNGENTNYIGYTVFLFIIVAFAYSVRYLRKARRNRTGLSLQEYVMIVSLLAIPLVLVWMLPPTIHPFGFAIKMPMGYLVEFAPYWRVPTRAFLALHPLAVLTAVMAIFFLLRTINLQNTKRAIAIVLILTTLLAVEYASGINRPSFSIDNMPKTYTWLSRQDDISSVAEVPIVDRPVEVAGYYVFAQMIHGKPIVNTSLSKTAIGLLNPLGSTTNPETINFLKSRRVDAVIVHAASCQPENWGTLIRTEKGTLPPPYTGSFRTSTCVYRLHDADPTDSFFVYAKQGFSKTNYMDSNGEYWVAAEKDKVTLQSVSDNGVTSGSGEAYFKAVLGTLGEFKKKPISWKLIQSGKIVTSGNAQGGHTPVEGLIETDKPFEIELRVDGVVKPAPGELGMKLMELIKK